MEKTKQNPVHLKIEHLQVSFQIIYFTSEAAKRDATSQQINTVHTVP